MTCVSSVGIIKSKKTMMKKEYVKPEFLVEDILLETMFAASVVEGGDNEDLGTNERDQSRGTWGDFWN